MEKFDGERSPAAPGSETTRRDRRGSDVAPFTGEPSGSGQSDRPGSRPFDQYCSTSACVMIGGQARTVLPAPLISACTIPNWIAKLVPGGGATG